MYIIPPLLEEPFAQTLSGKIRIQDDEEQKTKSRQESKKKLKSKKRQKRKSIKAKKQS
jgi:hypothetical protein